MGTYKGFFNTRSENVVIGNKIGTYHNIKKFSNVINRITSSQKPEVHKSQVITFSVMLLLLASNGRSMITTKVNMGRIKMANQDRVLGEQLKDVFM